MGQALGMVAGLDGLKFLLSVDPTPPTLPPGEKSEFLKQCQGEKTVLVLYLVVPSPFSLVATRGGTRWGLCVGKCCVKGNNKECL